MFPIVQSCFLGIPLELHRVTRLRQVHRNYTEYFRHLILIRLL